MSGDKLSLLTFLLGLAAAGVMGALSTNGWRSRVLWSLGLTFALASLVFLRAQTSSLLFSAAVTLWSTSPFIATALVILLTGGRKPLELRRSGKGISVVKPTLNPALSAAYLNDMVQGTTELEAKRKIDGLVNQLVQLKGQVKEISEVWGGTISASILGLQTRTQYAELNTVEVKFEKNEAEALERVKPGDWIEFIGEIEHSSLSGWRLHRAKFVGRADPPSPPAAPKRRRAPPKSA